MDKAKKTSLSLPDSLREAAQLRANNRFRGNFSGYVQSLIERDGSGEFPTSFQPEILDRLCEIYEGWLAPELAKKLSAANINQPRALASLLGAYFEYLQHAKDPYGFYLQDSAQWHLQNPVAAEDQAAYSAPKPPHKVETSETEHARAALRAGRHSKAIPTPPQPTPAGAA